MADRAFDGWLAARLLTERGLGLGLPLTVLPVATSTNDLGLEAARSGAEHGSAFVAEEGCSPRRIRVSARHFSKAAKLAKAEDSMRRAASGALPASFKTATKLRHIAPVSLP